MPAARPNSRQAPSRSPALVLWIVFAVLMAAIGMPALHAAHPHRHQLHVHTTADDVADHEGGHAAIDACRPHAGCDGHGESPEDPSDAPVDDCVLCVKLALAKHALRLSQADVGLLAPTPATATERVAESMTRPCPRPRESSPRGPPTA